MFNDYGEVRCRLRLNRDLKPGVALLPKGLWARSTESGTTASALAPDTLTDIGAGACFNDARVEVEALVEGATPAAGPGSGQTGRPARIG